MSLIMFGLEHNANSALNTVYELLLQVWSSQFETLQIADRAVECRVWQTFRFTRAVSWIAIFMKWGAHSKY